MNRNIVHLLVKSILVVIGLSLIFYGQSEIVTFHKITLTILGTALIISNTMLNILEISLKIVDIMLETLKLKQTRIDPGFLLMK